VSYSRSTGCAPGQSRLSQCQISDGRAATEIETISGALTSAPIYCFRRLCIVARTRLAGGASRDRTGDLKLAKLALSQLSYGPDFCAGVSQPKLRQTAHPSSFALRASEDNLAAAQRRLVGPGRVERPTSRLSGVRSNHLSYEPKCVRERARRPSHNDSRARIRARHRRKEGKRRGRQSLPFSEVGSIKSRERPLPIIRFLCLSSEVVENAGGHC
jgi:hypothetical protein